MGLRPLPNGNRNVLVSVPERALLELASDVGKTQSLAEAANLVIGLHNIRPAVLEKLMSHCTRVKIVRLVRDLGTEAGMQWAQSMQQHVERLGAGKRWSVDVHPARLGALVNASARIRCVPSQVIAWCSNVVGISKSRSFRFVGHAALSIVRFWRPHASIRKRQAGKPGSQTCHDALLLALTDHVGQKRNPSMLSRKGNYDRPRR